MADVFVSYARSTEAEAERIAQALRAAGHSVWRDDELPAHRAYSEVIEERLLAAGAVVVIWSADAAKSQWVRAEADTARKKGTLVQVAIDGTVPPIPFNQIQCANLKDWDGIPEAPGWRKVAASVAALVGDPGAETAVRGSKRSRKLSICVLPFANMSGDAEQEYFSDGISEDITTDLSNISALAVVARNTAFTFKGDAVDVTEVARKLGVSHVLEGSVRKAGQRVRITAQLIDGTTGDHLWAERYDRDLTDIFAIQDEISKAIVAALKLKLLPDEKKAIESRGTISAEAYNLYLMARQFWVTGNHGDRRREERVIRLCERAVQIDPNYARAWALMAMAQNDLRFGHGLPQIDGGTAADRALSLDPSIAEAHCVKARIAAEKGNLNEADAEIAEAVRLDPDSWEVNKEAGRLYLGRGLVDHARFHLEKAVNAIENDYHSWALLLTCYQAGGLREQVRKAGQMMLMGAEKALAEDPSNGAALGIGAGGLAATGQADRAKEWIERAILLDPDNLNMRYNFACVFSALLEDRDGAIALLEQVLPYTGPTPVRNAIADPDFDNIRDDPRFQKLIADATQRLGITTAEPATPPAA